MRLQPRRRRSVRQPQPSVPALIALSSLAPMLSQAVSFEPVPSANLDLSNLGRIGIAGDFNGISLYEYEGQIGKPLSRNGSESLLAQMPNGALAAIVSTDASIRSMCKFKLDGDDTDSVVIGGNFTSVDGTESTALAIFNPNTTKVTPLDGLQGEVNSILCDQDKGTIYIGGSFKGGNSTNAIAWDEKVKWKNLPFAGFNGPVKAISKASNGHIIFGGSFTGLGNASAPSEPDGQTINLSSAEITATNSASDKEVGNPMNVVCPTDANGAGRPWLAQDGAGASLDAKFGFGVEPTKLRLWNSHQDGRGTKTFRFYAYPINGIMNFTYTDPGTGDNKTCDSECTLDRDAKFQDFHFVNRVGMNAFRITISDHYGPGAGLAGMELFQDDIFAYAIKDFNEPKCSDTDFPSTASTTGPWKETPSRESNADYLTATFKGKVTSKSASVVFVPNIKESGNYSVNIYTPGCKQDQTCDNRGRVNVTGVMAGTEEGKFSTSLYQTNNYDKYDQIYFGYIEKTSDNFKPSVTLTPLADQDADELTVVAQRVGFSFINSTGGLNGLFDFDPAKDSVSTDDFQNSEINQLGASFKEESGVTSLVTSGDVIYIGGNFTSDDYKHIVGINSQNKTQALDGGLDGQVTNMHLEGNKLYLGGSFTNTISKSDDKLQHVAVYDTETNSWSALGGGVNGNVEFIVPLQINIGNNTAETMIALTGKFSECNKFDDFKSLPANGFAIWVPSKGNWLPNLGGSVPTYNGILTAAVVDQASNMSVYAGSISSAQLAADGAATLNDGSLGNFPVKMSMPSESSKVSRRDTSSDNVNGVVTGTFYDKDDSNITILAGHFSAEASKGPTVNNVIFIDGKDSDSVTGFGSEISADSVFVTLALHGSILYAGGKVSGTVDKNDIKGMAVYDLSKKAFTNQPPSISGGNATVSAISVRPETSDIYVAGSFRTAGDLACPGLCVFSTDADQWINPGDGIDGEATSMMWSSKTDLVVGGDLSVSGADHKYLVMYDAKKKTWKDFPGSDNIPGPVQVMTPASKDGDPLWVSGTSDDGVVYLMKYDGKGWHTADQKLAANTVVRSLQVFSLSEGHGKSKMVDDKQVLMLTGSIAIPDVGTVSAAIYNGTHYQPYALTINSNKAGSIAKIFTQKDDFFSSGGHHMPLVFVVLIGLAISLGLILLLVVSGILLDRLRKKREGYTPAPTSMYDRGTGMQRIPPRELLESLGRTRPGAAPHV